jgi:hypothetical protein
MFQAVCISLCLFERGASLHKEIDQALNSEGKSGFDKAGFL